MKRGSSCTVDDALACERAGLADSAERMCGTILERDRDNSDAWHLLARVALKKADLATAATRALEAIRRRPSVPAYHTTLGEILAARGQQREAAMCCREALRLAPDYLPALVNLGNALQAMQLFNDACIYYWRAIRQRPDCAEAFSNLGNALRSLGEYPEAVSCYTEASKLQPENAVHHANLSAGLIHLERYPEAEQAARRALALEPRLGAAMANLSVALTAQSRLTESETYARQALERAPATAHLHLNLGNLLLRQERPEEAEAELRRALQLRPNYVQAASNLAVALHLQEKEESSAELCVALLESHPELAEVWNNLGIVRQAQGRQAEALECFRQTLARRPEDPKAHVCRSLSLLALGRFAEGFAEYEWRWKLPAAMPEALHDRAWDGSPLAGRTILLWAEQGLGDTLEFVRFATVAAASGGRVVVAAPDCLVALARTVPGVAEAVPQFGVLPEFDVHAPLLSLPRLLGTTMGTIPRSLPYLSADPARVAEYRSRLGPARGLRVGVVWAGSPKHTSDRARSIALARLAPWGELAEVEWHSLQVEQRGAEDPRSSAPWIRPPLVERPNADYLAAMMECLDLVITVDSMPAHLAGALGRPVWTLLSAVPDWRWQVERESSPWYPGMRLWRQSHPGDWEAVVGRVADELRGGRFKLSSPDPISTIESRNERRSMAPNR